MLLWPPPAAENSVLHLKIRRQSKVVFVMKELPTTGAYCSHRGAELHDVQNSWASC